MTPSCPPHYTCTFSPKNPPYHYMHWWDGPWGIVVATLVVIALASVLLTVAYYVKESSDSKRNRLDRDRERQAQLAIEEQRTMQLDAAKGNPEMLKLVRTP